MKTSFISTATLLNGPRATIGRLQAQIDKAAIETEGRYADVGLELGYKTGISLDLRQHVAAIDAQQQRNGLTTVRLATAQGALSRIRSDGEAFLALLAPGKLSDNSSTAVAQTAASNLSTFIGQMNATSGGQYLFAGINTAQTPLTDYQASPPSAAKQAFTQAFRTAFGFDPGTQPDSGNITATQMQAFLDGPFAALFADPQWGANWSSASNVNVRSEITDNETAETSVNANVQAARDMAMLYTLATDIGLSSLTGTTQTAVYDRLRSLASSATLGFTAIQADLGVVQARLGIVDRQHDAQKNILKTGFGSLENTDEAEAAARVTKLSKQLDIAYALTNQVSKLSLIDYVR
ncbi:flagellar hook-associated protein 3 FlgL [Methylobacterium sp. UNC378MF]|uniref:flagellar hook-associated family protein n=1 Tax=Methylobacterium sp. UNC378MF TaxID=1502748 RepID=UPI00088D8862|nr:flagellar hook-associated family protein [Methylobacterium sp. UNC378MF]SDA11409.1 flagellar hook-associated protein 3 FlgL [Methylobacterium sp. UNC378MF]